MRQSSAKSTQARLPDCTGATPPKGLSAAQLWARRGCGRCRVFPREARLGDLDRRRLDRGVPSLDLDRHAVVVRATRLTVQAQEVLFSGSKPGVGLPLRTDGLGGLARLHGLDQRTQNPFYGGWLRHWTLLPLGSSSCDRIAELVHLTPRGPENPSRNCPVLVKKLSQQRRGRPYLAARGEPTTSAARSRNHLAVPRAAMLRNARSVS